MQQRHVLLNDQNQIISRFLWNPADPWDPPPGCSAMLEAEAAAKGYAEAPPLMPSTPDDLEAREFMDRLPEATRRSIVAAAAVNPDLRLLLDTLLGGRVDVRAQRTKDGVAAMQAAGLITKEQAGDLLR